MARLLWTNHANFGPSARSACAMCYDSARSRTVLFGGNPNSAQPGDGALGDTWEWDGEFWTQMDDIGPAPRFLASMAYDSVRKVSLLFGGTDNAFFGDTWQWDGTNWTKLSETGPSPRSSAAMAFDGTRGRAVLFAGESRDNFHLNDTWEFDGQTWTQVQDVGPAPRAAHAMAFDVANNRTVLFGGVDANNNDLGDTWAWDGREWAQIAEFGPAPRRDAALATAGGASLVLFGGITSKGGSRIFGDTWEFDGKLWTQRQDIGPGPLQDAAMAFDGRRSRIVLFGGLAPGVGGNSATASALTWETSAASVAASPTPATLKVLSISVDPTDPMRGDPVNITFTLNGPAPAGGAVVLIGPGIMKIDGGPLLNVTVNAGQTILTVPAMFSRRGPINISAGIQQLGEATTSVNVQVEVIPRGPLL